jgi:UDP-2,3-diacylglucosamine pyrophosphatase LpxH
VFHGDVFDASIQRARWLAQIAGKGYDLLIWLNRAINQVRNRFGYPSVAFAANVKKNVKGAVKYIGDFEHTAIELAAEKGYDYVLCGHIHRPQMREVTASNGHTVTYLNSGDWVEHLTALEFDRGKWSIYQYDAANFEQPDARKLPRERARRGYRLSREEILPEPGVSAAAMEALG